MTKLSRIAVVGIGGVFPGGKSLEDFWQNISETRDCSTEVDDSRWLLNKKTAYSEKYGELDRVAGTRGYFVNDWECNADGLNIEPSQLSKLDPLFHLTLTAGSQAFADCKLDAVDMSRVSVVFGNIVLPTEKSSAIAREYLGSTFEEKILGTSSRSRDTHPINSFPTGMPGGVLAKALGILGGSYTLDAACASSLYALKMAVDQLQLGKSDAVLAGGVSRPDPLYTQMGFSQLTALSRSGIARPFDERADGLIVGEGSGFFVLKRLEDALDQNDRIYATIAGIGLSNDVDGGLMAPSSEGQLRAMREAYRVADWEPKDVDMIECHATGTPLGDLVEFSSLKELWSTNSDFKSKPQSQSTAALLNESKCVLGSVKSNVGHLLTAAGASGLCRVLLAMKNKTFPATANYSDSGDRFDLKASPFEVLSESKPWPKRSDNSPRRAALSGFGFGGINAHVLLEEWDENLSASYLQDSENPISLSGATSVEPTNSGFEHSPRKVAIVGIEAVTADSESMEEIFEKIGISDELLKGRTPDTWCGTELSKWFAEDFSNDSDNETPIKVNSIREVPVAIGRFRIAPTELKDMLPQQLLMLHVADLALKDCDYGRKVNHKTGVFIGLSLDGNANNFNCRWELEKTSKSWAQKLDPSMSDSDLAEWRKNLKDAIGPALNADRTMGSLGGIVASRISREFQFGGSGFTVSNEENSGLRALEIAVNQIQLGHLDVALVGAVDFAGQLQTALSQTKLDGLKHGKFSKNRIGSDGAIALVVKDYDLAVKNGNKIYGAVDSIQFTSSDLANQADHSEEINADLNESLKLSNTSIVEHEVIEKYVGNLGAAAGLFDLGIGSKFLSHKIMPPSEEYPVQHWLRNRIEGARSIQLPFVSKDGNQCIVKMTEGENTSANVSEFECGSSFRENNLIFTARGTTYRGLMRKIQKLSEFVDSRVQEPLQNISSEWWDACSGQLGTWSIAIVSQSVIRLQSQLKAIVKTLESEKSAKAPLAKRMLFAQGICFSSEVRINDGQLAFMYPGVGQQYPGMGRKLALAFPDVLDSHDANNLMLKDQFFADEFWKRDCQDLSKLNNGPAFGGQAALGAFITSLLERMAVKPSAVIGYSLGESTGLIAAGAWENRDEIYSRILMSPLFTQELSGEYLAVKKHWGLGADESVDWFSCAVRLSSNEVSTAIEKFDRVYLLNINTPNECVIAGDRSQIESALKLMNVESFELPNLPAIHCSVVKEVEEEYREFHDMKVSIPENIKFYSSATGAVLKLSNESVSESLLDHGINGVNFPATIEAAYANGVRTFVEIGPGSSTSRMVSEILGERAHMTFSLCPSEEKEVEGFLRGVARLYSEGMKLDLSILNSKSKLDDVSGGKAKQSFSLTVPVMASEFDVSKNNIRRDVLAETGKRLEKQAANRISDRHAATSANLSELAEFKEQITNSSKLKKSPDQKPATGEIATDSLNRHDNEHLDSVESGVEFSRNGHSEEFDRVVNRDANSGQTGIFASQPTQNRSFDKNDGQLNSIPSELELSLSNDFDRVNYPSNELMEAIDATMNSNMKAHQLHLQSNDQSIAMMGDVLQQQLELLAKGQNLVDGTENVNDTVFNGILDNGDMETKAAWTQDEANLTADKRTLYDGYNDEVRPAPFSDEKAWLDYEQCREFAKGKIENVLGSEFSEIDQYETRTRLPEGPLLLCHRIMSVDAEPKSMGTGTLVTEHDIFENAWYLDQGRIPTCIAVEAGQADLFLASYLGIDFKSKGKRVYRLLDAVVTFYQGLPKPGDTIRYEIKIDEFFNQGETILFRFSFEASVNGIPLMSMRKGCAGFFTEAELDEGRGIVLSSLDKAEIPGKVTGGFTRPLPMTTHGYTDEQVDALRSGDYASCFGDMFKHLNFKNPGTLPGGMMRLVHRINKIEPDGGRFGLGVIYGEADIRPDDWFLKCHFVDDKVMPGTLMYECCLHTLRVYLMRMGWVGEAEDMVFEPIVGEQSRLKCRGQVLESTKKVTYEIVIREIGYRPEAYAIVDAFMYADGKPVVEITRMTTRILGLNKPKVDALWASLGNEGQKFSDTNSIIAINSASPDLGELTAAEDYCQKPALYGYDRIKAYCEGKPSDAFGDRYKIFDGSDRKIARLPREPFCFLDRVTEIEARQWEIESGGHIEAKYDVPTDAWYFEAESQGRMPFSILLEAALQPCGWYSAYMGSALSGDEDLSYRNLGGYAVQHLEVTPSIGTLTTLVKSTKVSVSGGMVIQEFDFTVTAGDKLIYDGHTMFGFFTKAALAQQVGVRGATPHWKEITDDPNAVQPYPEAPVLPKAPILMVDEITSFSLEGGRNGLGYIKGTKAVVPSEWFYEAHFFEDPVMPGSLGLETFAQLLKVYSGSLWDISGEVALETPALGAKHQWVYRGQVLPTNKLVTVEVEVSKICHETNTIFADGYLMVDGLVIYEIKDFSIRVVET